MSLTIAALVVFFLAALVHAGSLLAKERGATYSFCGHLWLTSPLWLAVVVLAVIAGMQPPDFALSPGGKLFGLIVGVAGIGIAVWHFVLLGFRQMMGSRFFGIPPRIQRGGLYAITQNPMYIGFTLAFFGFSLALGSFPLLALGISSIVLLHLFLAPIENRGMNGFKKGEPPSGKRI